MKKNEIIQISSKAQLMLLTIIASMLSSCNSNKQVKKDSNLEITKLLQTKLDSLTDNKIIPGVTLSVRFKDQTNISLASGWADIENKIPMKPDDIMFSGSVGKTYVAAVVLKLYEQGLIDLKAKAIDYLRDTAWFLKVQNASEITVEMLLNHTAGIPEYVYKQGLWQVIKENPDKVWNVE